MLKYTAVLVLTCAISAHKTHINQQDASLAQTSFGFGSLKKKA